MTHFLGTDRRKAAPPVARTATLTWRPCGEDLSIWRMLWVRPDRELFATIDLARAELLSFEVEWDDAEAYRRFVTWSVGSGFTAGMTDSKSTTFEAGEGPFAADPEILGMALVIVEDAGLVSLVATWIMDRLSAALARRSEPPGGGDEDGPHALAGPGGDGRRRGGEGHLHRDRGRGHQGSGRP